MDREKLVENIVTFIPLMFKRLMKAYPAVEMPKQQLELLFFISKANRKPMNFYSERMMIPKSNLTVIADKLIEEGLIKRGSDPDDRRVIILEITDKGQVHLEEHKRLVRKEMIKRLETLDDKDIRSLNEHIEAMKTILEKLFI